MPSVLIGAPNTRAHMSSLLLEGMRSVFGLEWERHDEGFVEEIFNVDTKSKKNKETDVVMAGLGMLLPKAEGDNFTYDAMQEAWSATAIHATWALGVEWTEEAFEDNLYLSIGKRSARELARVAQYTRTVQAFSYFNDLTETIYSVGGTDYQVLETAHFRVDGGTWSNRPTNATSLSNTAYEAALMAWTTGMVDQRGLKLEFRPEVLMVGPSNESLGWRILNSQQRQGSADNDANFARTRKVRLFVNPHLTDDGRWFLLANKKKTRHTFFDRVSAGVRDAENAANGNMRKVVRSRFSKMCAHPVGTYGSP